MSLLESITSSRHRLTIAQLISIRPRTLKELADRTGISIQGVLKHLSKLEKLGLVEEKTISGAKYLGVRKVYSTRGSRIGDFSRAGLTIVNLGKDESGGTAKPAKGVYAELDGLAEEILVQRRRINNQTRRLQRMIDEFSASESRLKRLLESLDLDSEEKVIASAVFTEDTLGGAATVLSKFYDCPNPDEAIRSVMEKVKKTG